MTVNGIDYREIKLLGHGKGGYSYLVESESGEQYVLKQIHHEPCDYYTFGNKIESEKSDYQRLLNAGIRIPKMLDIDISAERIIKEYIPGMTIAEMLAEGIAVDKYIPQVEEMAEKSRVCGFNIDYYPTNFVVCEEKLYYIDYECSEYSHKWSFAVWGITHWKKTGSLDI